MDRKLFLQIARKWHGEDAEASDGMHNHMDFFIVDKNGEKHFTKQIHEIFTDEGDKRVIVKLPTLDCGCVVDDPKELLVIAAQKYCRRCVQRCPSCGDLIVPGTGEQVEQVWYHRQCAVSPKEHFELKRYLEEGFLAAKLKGANRQNELIEAQIETAHANVIALHERLRLESERFWLEEKREEAQRTLMAAQAEATLENTRLQSGRLELEKEQSRERSELERENLADKRRALDSQLESEKLQRAIGAGKFELEWMERIKKLEEDGYLPKGTADKLLP